MKKGFGKQLLAVVLAGVLMSTGAAAFADEEIVMETDEALGEVYYEDTVDVEETEEVAVEEAEVVPEEEFIDVEVDDGYEDEEEYIEIPVDPEENAVVEVEDAILDDEYTESIIELSEVEETSLWQYRYAGNPNLYFDTICEWLSVYHSESAIPDTGMIPAIHIVGVDDSDRSDIRLYGFFEISDYSVDGTTLVDVNDELITGCMHLEQLSEDEYIVRAAEVLDSNNMTGSARTLTGGDLSLMQGLLTGGISEAEKAQFIRDFVWTYNIGAEAYQDRNGVLHPMNYEAFEAPEWVSNLEEALVTDQIVTVGKTTGCNAILSLYEKQMDDSWTCLIEVPAVIGKEGLGKTLEGDGRTPIGTYSFTQAFGLGDDPGCGIPYTVCGGNYYWNEDSTSGRYNQLVTTDQYTEFSTDVSDRIADKPEAYQYALALSYNEDAVPYGGSGIFIRCSQPESFSTDGSIAIPTDAMVFLLENVKNDARVIIDTIDNLKTQHLSAESRGA